MTLKTSNYYILLIPISLLLGCGDGDGDPFAIQKGLIGLYVVLSVVIGVPLLLIASSQMLTNKESTLNDRFKGLLGVIAMMGFIYLVYLACNK